MALVLEVSADVLHDVRPSSASRRPLVRLLSFSTDAILRLFGVHQVKEPGVTVDEIRVMLKPGAEEGVFELAEHEMVTNALHLDDRHVGAVLTPRTDVTFLDLQLGEAANREILQRDAHAVLPLCDGGLDHVVGLVRTSRVLEQALAGLPLDFRAIADPPLFVPESMSLMKLLEGFKRSHLPVALTAIVSTVCWPAVAAPLPDRRPAGTAEDRRIATRLQERYVRWAARLPGRRLSVAPLRAARQS